MSKVKIDGPKQSHNYAQCLVCDADWDLFDLPEERNDMLKHVRKTGHTVVRESNSVSYYRAAISQTKPGEGGE